MKRALLLLLALAACSQTEDTGGNGTVQVDLERAAIAAGIVRDPAETDITGLYARDTDRVCIVPEIVGYSIGATTDFGDGIGCSGQGTVTRSGETLHVEFKNADGCSFDARFDGERIDFPGRLPEPCKKLCSVRASFAALEADLLSDSIAEAATLRDGRGRMLCRSDDG
jgi:hypothetical protein